VARRPGLGRGLDSLIPSSDGRATPPTGGGGPALLEIPVGDLSTNPNQPRLHFDEEALAELSASIAEIGVLQPLLVRALADGSYQIIAGERRWRAAQRAGLVTVPAVVKTTDDMSSVEQALVENLHRQDLLPLEESAAYQQLIDDFGLTHDAVAKRVGKSRASISNALRLLTLPPSIQGLLADGKLTAGHAKALLGSPDRLYQEQVARRAADEGWSVRAVEEAIRDRGMEQAGLDGGEAISPTSGGTTRPVSRLRQPAVLELEQRFSDYLGTKVEVKMAGLNKKGSVTITFAGLEDLERIYLLMMGAGEIDPDE